MTSRQILVLKTVIGVLAVGIALVGVALARYAIAGADRTPHTELERAVVAAEEAVKANPEDPASRVKLAAAYLERGDTGGALEQARVAIRLAPKDPSGYYVLGLVESRGGDLDGAVRDLTTAVKTKGQLAQFYQDAYVALARVQERRGATKDALASMSRALDYGPENVILLFERGQVYERARDWKNAMDDYGAALEFVPNYTPAQQALEALKKAHPDVFRELQRLYNETTTGAAPSGRK